VVVVAVSFCYLLIGWSDKYLCWCELKLKRLIRISKNYESELHYGYKLLIYLFNNYIHIYTYIYEIYLSFAH
jgi:hypothetical protein